MFGIPEKNLQFATGILGGVEHSFWMSKTNIKRWEITHRKFNIAPEKLPSQ